MNNTQSQNEDPIMTMIVVMILIGGIGVGIWYLGKPIFAWASAQSALHLRYLLYPITPLFSEEKRDFILHMNVFLERNLDVASASGAEIYVLYKLSMQSLSVVLIPLLLWRGINNLMFAKDKAFKRHLTLQDLAKIHAQREPRMKPIIKADLLNTDHRFGPWATSLNPLPFLIKTKCIYDEPMEEHKQLKLPRFATLSEVDAMNNLNKYYGHLLVNVSKVRHVFEAQLGKPVKLRNGIIDINALPTIERTMAIIFLAALTGKKSFRDRIDALLDQFGDSFEEGLNGEPHKIDLTGVDQLGKDILSEYDVKHHLMVASKQHAYWTTFFTYLYTQAYEIYGNMISRDFAFLKPVNRRLYLLCNQVGLEQARVEARAIREHYEMEMRSKYALLKPQLHTCVELTLGEIQSEGWFAKEYVEDTFDNEYAELLKTETEAKQQSNADTTAVNTDPTLIDRETHAKVTGNTNNEPKH